MVLNLQFPYNGILQNWRNANGAIKQNLGAAGTISWGACADKIWAIKPFLGALVLKKPTAGVFRETGKKK